ncbi:MAG TPA: phosphatidylserine decarboxylase [Bacillus sp. (in: firmicutes)]|uniref:phosphatidylserine decarboxylase n=1 Tax=Bacillus litorisediminis TaxID=2922713 RepID=UPI001FAFAB9B|nr:phosphatidylserine decarboxylase [Bacillus litorisediminis]HWO78775.1 phosphatidylserine decarboxylase [Bacillus sp. (in: firmicutes)]
MVKEKLYRTMIELTNGPVTSKLLQKITMSKWSKALIPLYMRAYKIKSHELMIPPKQYPSLQDFFIRKLKNGARVIEKGDKIIISPVDGVLEEWGLISENTEMVIKGKVYSVQEMVGNEAIAKDYIGGKFVLLYLSPAHYHRIHAPYSGKIISKHILGNKSYPVNRLGLLYGKSPLSKNYRLATEIKGEHGKYAIIKIGAMFVNSIEWTNPNERVEKGEELGYFSFGSSVVLLFPKGFMEMNQELKKGTTIFMGNPIGIINEGQ